MGRGKEWDAPENEALASAWIAASEDPIAGSTRRPKPSLRRCTDASSRRDQEQPTCLMGSTDIGLSLAVGPTSWICPPMRRSSPRRCEKCMHRCQRA
eukprot:IDg6594t1